MTAALTGGGHRPPDSPRLEAIVRIATLRPRRNTSARWPGVSEPLWSEHTTTVALVGDGRRLVSRHGSGARRHQKCQRFDAGVDRKVL